LTTRPLDPAELAPDAVRFVARKAHGKEEPDLTDHGKRMVALLKEQVPLDSRKGGFSRQFPKRDRRTRSVLDEN